MTPFKLPRKLNAEPVAKKNAGERFSASSEPPPEQRLRLVDSDTGEVWGFVVVDNTQRGPGLGGLRMAPNVTLEEVSRLARTMTLKNSAACLPFGGGKSGLAVDPRILAREPGLRRDLIGLYADAVFAEERYIPAPDMGTDEADIQQIYEAYSGKLGNPVHLRGGAGRPPEKGGVPIDGWGLTAQGLYAAARTLETLDASCEIKNMKVVIQGYGNVGSWIAVKLINAGATLIGASDIHAALWNPDGLDVEALNAVRKEPSGLDGYPGRVAKKLGPDRLDWLLEAPCDLLIPAARPDAITARNADRIQCRIVLQGANTPSNKMTEYYLNNRRGILSLSDFIVNVGGVIGCAVELKMTGDTAYRDAVNGNGARQYLDDLIYRTVSKNVQEIHNRLAAQKGTDVIFREEAEKLARERLDSKNVWL